VSTGEKASSHIPQHGNRDGRNLRPPSVPGFGLVGTVTIMSKIKNAGETCNAASGWR
jgi:hypothetical protein